MPSRTVFLSCRDEDAPRSEPVRRALAAAQWTIIGGRDAISTAGLFVACVSAGGYVAEELEIAIASLQRLEHDRSWLMVVPLDHCNVPTLPITPKVTLRDLVINLDQLNRSSNINKTGGTLQVEARSAGVQAPDAVGIGAIVSAPGTGNQTVKTDIGTVTGDETGLLIGAIISDRHGDD